MVRPKTSDAGRPWPGLAGKTLRLGFTLVELLVVIAIIALLLSILTPSLRRAKSMAIRIKCAHNLKQINLAMNLYLNGNDETYPCAQDPLPPGYWLWMGRGWRSFVEPHLSGNIDVNNPSVLFCPADPTAKDKYESTSYSYSMAFYHSPQQIDAMSSPADTYGNTSPPSISQRCWNVAQPSGKILIGEWLSNHSHTDKDDGWWGWQGRRNYLFADGQVRYLQAKEIRPARDGFPNANLTVRGIKGLDYPSN
ncbi:MAG: type II secretion system protein [Planctomycetota bacterium]|jgi:prepilin-type N-terminal cleavage/methylation domain-containing protein/prepilin-type processing-associated H-X9-DG protein